MIALCWVIGGFLSALIIAYFSGELTLAALLYSIVFAPAVAVMAILVLIVAGLDLAESIVLFRRRR